MGLFKKDKAEDHAAVDSQAVQTFEPASAAAPAADVSADEAVSADAEQKGKHGEPGVCCGSCH